MLISFGKYTEPFLKKLDGFCTHVEKPLIFNDLKFHFFSKKYFHSEKRIKNIYNACLFHIFDVDFSCNYEFLV